MRSEADISHSVAHHERRATRPVVAASSTTLLNGLTQRCDSRWQEARARRGSLWADHINYAKQLEREGKRQTSGIVSLRNKRRGWWHSQITACGQPRRPHDTVGAQVEFLKNRAGGQTHYHESGPLEGKGSVVAHSSLFHEKKNMANNVFGLNLHTEAAVGERKRQTEI